VFLVLVVVIFVVMVSAFILIDVASISKRLWGKQRQDNKGRVSIQWGPYEAFLRLFERKEL
jgi:hypothetical protein